MEDHTHTEDDQITQMHTIAGRRSISNAVARLSGRLKRSRSAAPLTTGNTNMVIGVSVEEATAEAPEAESSRSTAYVSGGLRNQPSTLSMSASNSSGNRWVGKVKGFTQKFKRKSKIGHSETR